MKKKSKSYIIKVPVYTTEMIENPNGLFGSPTYENMIEFITNKLTQFSSKNKTINIDNRIKTKQTVIKDINYSVNEIGINKGILLKVSAYSTNLYDGYLENKKKIEFNREDKIGSDTNFILIYPMIIGLERENYTTYFIVLIYEDPTKINEEISKIAKVILNNVLEIPITNIKLPSIMDELKKMGEIPELQLKYSSIINDDNEVDIKYRTYFQKSRIRKQREDFFKNMPFEKVEELIYNNDDNEEYQKLEIKLTNGKKEYKIMKELLSEAGEVLKESAEKVFNASTAITEQELNDKIHDVEFIISKLKPILENFISINNES